MDINQNSDRSLGECRGSINVQATGWLAAAHQRGHDHKDRGWVDQSCAIPHVRYRTTAHTQVVHCLQWRQLTLTNDGTVIVFRLEPVLAAVQFASCPLCGGTTIGLINPIICRRSFRNDSDSETVQNAVLVFSWTATVGHCAPCVSNSRQVETNWRRRNHSVTAALTTAQWRREPTTAQLISQSHHQRVPRRLPVPHADVQFNKCPTIIVITWNIATSVFHLNTSLKCQGRPRPRSPQFSLNVM